MAVCFDILEGDALFALYCILLFSLSFGPNLTTYILPAETYPKEVRSTFNGFSAALGKLGAFLGVYLFGSIAAVTNYPTVMGLCCGFALLGAAITFFLLPGTRSSAPSSVPYTSVAHGSIEDDLKDTVVVSWYNEERS